VWGQSAALGIRQNSRGGSVVPINYGKTVARPTGPVTSIVGAMEETGDGVAYCCRISTVS